MLQAHQRAWNELSGGPLKLERFFARQALVGGTYLWTRFRKQADLYNPEVLTLLGSVFVLETREKKRAEQKLQEWLRQGLSQLANAPGGED